AGEAILRYFGSREAVPDNAVLQDRGRRHCAPELVVGRGSVARAAGVSSMTDNSDGLLRDLTTLAERSGVQLDLDGASLTPDAQLYYAGEVLGVDPWQWVLTGGEDHTLVGTTAKDVPAGYRRLGVVHEVSGGSDLPRVTVDGQPPIYTGGWDSLG
ncbi:MAG: thiamine-phosphate kinase, partial [Corynebacterium sp.]|nr:thiamine-phosphate kinase [Corynebacterium sp.]